MDIIPSAKKHMDRVHPGSPVAYKEEYQYARQVATRAINEANVPQVSFTIDRSIHGRVIGWLITDLKRLGWRITERPSSIDADYDVVDGPRFVICPKSGL